MDEALPFFSYGLFKPGQLAHHQIADFVDYDKTKKSAIKGRLKERDGIPILVPGNDFEINGHLIFFKAGREQRAYQIVEDFEPRKIYYWRTLNTIDNHNANVLIGKKPNKGCEELEYVADWDGNADPLFLSGLELVDEIIQDEKEWDGNYKSIFRVQMAYILLWSSVERYVTLRYGVQTKNESINYKLKRMASEPLFASGLRKHVRRTSAKVVRSTNPKEIVRLNITDPEQAVKYYYQVRSNAVHRGKAVNKDFYILRDSTSELLAIFRCMLTEAFSTE